jgi:Na+/H+ antiporter NhaD/arsenite permease-like protein
MFDLLKPPRVATVGGLSATAAILSNVISNVPAVMLLTKIIPRLPDPGRAWLALAMSSTLAGNLTILGSIANLIVVEGARRRGHLVTFWEYARIGIPLSLITIVIGVLWLS